MCLADELVLMSVAIIGPGNRVGMFSCELVLMSVAII